MGNGRDGYGGIDQKSERGEGGVKGRRAEERKRVKARTGGEIAAGQGGSHRGDEPSSRWTKTGRMDGGDTASTGNIGMLGIRCVMHEA